MHLNFKILLGQVRETLQATLKGWQNLSWQQAAFHYHVRIIWIYTCMYMCA